MRSRLAHALLCTGLCAACGAGEGADPALAPGANVVLIVVDTLRADHLGGWGAERATSPRIDALARESLVVDTMVAQAPWTKPSMASLFTSLYPGQHGTVEETTENHLAVSLVTLAECFQQAGYVTVGFSENPHISPSTAFDQGFDQLSTLSGFVGDREWVVESARAGLDAIEARRGERPFFLYLHFLDPHGPYQPKGPWREEFLAGRQTQRAEVRQGLVGRLVEGARPTAPIAEEDVDYLRALYDAEIRETDLALAQVLADLEGRGLLEDAVVVLTSDHGEEFLEHGTLKHGYQLFEESLRVPLVLRVPGATPRREAQAVAQHIDLAPTLLELVGLPVPSVFQGRSLVPLVRGEPLEETVVVSATAWRGIDLVCARKGRWKLIVDRADGSEQLFDLVEDPGETRDLLHGQEAIAGMLRAAIERAETPPAGVTLSGLEGQGDPDAERALKALGYFGK
ncbi:MAG TPA: sulfatase [Planctomycetota bacterium]|nr:sulfatase [Planctomycetota bacterium]